MRSFATAFFIVAGVVGCSSSPGSAFTAAKEKTEPSLGAAGGFGSSEADASSGTTAPGCTEAATFVYVVSEENDLYRFDPSSLTFTKIGPLKCQVDGDATPFSMAVDRTGTAWVDYDDGTLYKVSTQDASCQKTGYSDSTGWSTFGMGFSSSAAGAPESLYVLGCDVGSLGSGLARIDTTTFALQKIGDLGAAEQDKCGELTGTGDGRLYGLFDGSPAGLGKIDAVSSSTTLAKTLPGVDVGDGSAYAFSFWGGDFWFYTATDGAPSKITRYKAATDGSITDVVANVGFTIVGAGVSTCAPTGPLK